jgi:RNA polymerase sigma-70 factor (ECF subfamily)
MGSAPLSEATLHEVLLPRIEGLRAHVRRKIPRRFRHVVGVDDVLQNVWIAAYRTVANFRERGPDSIDRWLTTIASTKLVDALRMARRVKRGGDRQLLHDSGARLTSMSGLFARLQSPQRTPSREMHAAEAGHMVLILLNTLKDARRRAIEMRYLEGRSHNEIARELGKSAAAVNSLLFHGLRELRDLLGAAGKYLTDARSSDAVPADEPGAC